MTYSCCDFVDTVLDALGIVVPDESSESPSDQADLTLARLNEMADLLSAARTYLSAEADWRTSSTPPDVFNLINRIDAVLSPMAGD